MAHVSTNMAEYWLVSLASVTPAGGAPAANETKSRQYGMD